MKKRKGGKQNGTALLAQNRSEAEDDEIEELLTIDFTLLRGTRNPARYHRIG